MKPTLLIMAAGLGSRYGSLKQMDRFGPSGETMLEYAVYDALQAGFGQVVFVIRRSMEADFREVFYGKLADKIHIDYVLQELDQLPAGLTVPPQREKPWGTGHAVLVAADKIHTPFAVINADDFYGARSFQLIADFLQEVQHSTGLYGLIGYPLNHTLSEHGHVSRGICQTDEEGYLLSVTERTHIVQDEQQNIVYHTEEGTLLPLTGHEMVSMNLMGFTPDVLPWFRRYFIDFMQAHQHQLKAEFYLPFVLNELIRTGKARVKLIPTREQWFGVTYKEDKIMAQQRLKALVAQGIYPTRLWQPQQTTE